jgi:UDP-N-acetylmuramoyl-tripeptide--D-alanyl-D-alanine ligase
MKMTANKVASWMGGELVTGGGNTSVEGVSIDSRTLESGDLFFAIIGPRHDGHRYVDQALERGAVGVVVSGPVSARRPGVMIRVDDTTHALGELGAAVRRESGIRVVAITGSMGKTTTKETTAAALSARFRVLKSEKNLNNQYGVPLSVLKHRNEEVAVLELGMSAPGEIARLTEITQPDVGVLTNVADVHREFFPSLEAIARAKGELLDGLSESAVAVVNGDDPLVVEQARRFQGRQIRYGLSESADVFADDVARTEEGLRFVARYGDERVEVRAPLFGRHNVYNLLSALAVAAAFELPWEEVVEKLAGLGPAPHRGERLRFREGFLVIDETYNSNPAALVSVLDSFAEEAAPRRIAVLGDMLELGERAESAHLESGAKAAESKLAFLLGVGPLGGLIVEGARLAGMKESRLACVEKAEEAAQWIADHVGVGDVILLKASRGVGLDRALEVLRNEFTLESD